MVDEAHVDERERLGEAPGVGGRGERPPVAAKPGLHPPSVDLVQRVHPGAVLGREQDDVQEVVGVVEELAKAPRGGERRRVDVDPEEAEELVVVEGGGAGAPDAREQRIGRLRSRDRGAPRHRARPLRSARRGRARSRGA